jgi:type I restriction enzyme R subunit
VRGLPLRNLAVELLRKLLAANWTRGRKTSCRRGRSPICWRMHRRTRTGNRTAQVIEELIETAREMRRRSSGEIWGQRGRAAFYDALAVNEVREGLGEPTLKTIARELVRRCETTSRSTGQYRNRCGPSCVCW